ncbi:MAG: hypothetical protein FWB93_06045 [Oscillospiraceae bacterium]|nr:hypothetical protein [Oscillospiraceae bacterium]
MPVIYQPRGKAREYNPLACNLYIGCSHRCKYCYAPHALQKREEDYFGTPSPRRDILAKIEDELRIGVGDGQIMLSFIGDVYGDTTDDCATTRGALELFLKHGANVSVLTKGGSRCLRDLDLFRQFGDKISVGATLTFIDPAKSAEWESGAAPPVDRLSALCQLKEAGIHTFASLEPVIEPEETLALIEAATQLGCIDLYKIGKLSGHKMPVTPDWNDFLSRALDMIRDSGSEVYIKQDLREAAPDIPLRAEETIGA